jgi:tetratricopeptide (TPR) repeat protein
MATHFLAPPWGLPGELDDTLAEYLEAEDYGSAVTLLRDHVPGRASDPRLLLILAHCRFQDALEVMQDELLSASQEALKLIDTALEGGIPLTQVAPFREEVERVLAEQTTLELKVLAAIPEDGDYRKLKPATLMDAAYLLWDREPAKAARLFEAAAEKIRELKGGAPGTVGPWFNEQLRAALCFFEAGEVERARPVLEAALDFDWKAAGIWQDRRMTETAFARVLELKAREHDLAGFAELWKRAKARSEALGFTFPSTHKDQERLLDICLQLGAGEHARELAAHIEGAREQVGRILRDKLRRARTLVPGPASLS